MTYFVRTLAKDGSFELVADCEDLEEAGKAYLAANKYKFLRGVLDDSLTDVTVEAIEAVKNYEIAHTPRPNEIRTTRMYAGVSKVDAALSVFATVDEWEGWESGDRKMHPARWDLFMRRLADD